MTIDLKRVSLWLSRYNSASFHRLRVSIGAHDGLTNPGGLKGQSHNCLKQYVHNRVSYGGKHDRLRH